MSQDLYCWRCDLQVPMLDENEWERIQAALSQAIADIQQYRKENASSLREAREQAHGRTALQLYNQITGFAETNVNAIWHRRIAIYGPPCPACGKPLRTPKASFCAACGAPRSGSPPI